MTGVREKMRRRNKRDSPTDDRCKREEEEEGRNNRDSPTEERCKREGEEQKGEVFDTTNVFTRKVRHTHLI